MLDVIIVGMGPAGMSAGIYALRSGLNTLVFEKNSPGGLINTTNLVDNYLGYDNITGPDLAFKMFEHFKNNGVNYKIEEVLKIKKTSDYFEVTTNKGIYKSLSVILAGGRQPKKVDTIENIKGINISRCSICDAPLYRDKDVLVLGGGNGAFEEGIYLSEFAKNLYIVSRSSIKADEQLVEEAKSKKNIKIFDNQQVKNVVVNNNDYLVELTHDELTVQGIFSYIGYAPSTEYLSNLNILEDSGYIEVNNTMTSIDGLFACGDIIKKDLYQIINACGEGATAATKAKRFVTLKNKGE